MITRTKYFFRYLFNPLCLAILLVALDQGTKYFIRNNFALGETRPVWQYLQITYLTNTGIAFSMFQGANVFFSVFTSVVLLGFIVWFVVNAPGLHGFIKAAAILVISGAAGNLIDRLAYGHVTDFIDVFYGSRHFPAFNVADSCISIGGACLFVWLLLSAKEDMDIKKGNNVSNSD
jgi:signal peptidase II